METKTWNDYFIGIANQVKLKSKDIHTQIGVVIVGDDRQIISTGYNSFPRGIIDDIDDRQQRPEKYYWFAHAEVNAIYNAALNGVSTKNSIMYMTCGTPCCNCTHGIINAGIRKVVYNQTQSAKDVRWDEHSIRSIKMFEEAGVEIQLYA